MILIRSLSFSVFICAVPSVYVSFDDVNVLLLYAMCPKCFEDCSMLDGIEGLFIVNESHVEWNVVLGGLFKYLSDRM